MAFTLDKFRLDGKVAIVTGAGGRPNSIGEAYSLGLAAAGARVVCADLVKEGAEACADRVKAAGGTAIGLQVDISSEVSVNAMAQAAKEAFGGVDILVNNAALMVEVEKIPTSETPLDSWDQVFAVNVTGALNCSAAVIPSMRQRGGGKIVNQSSAGAFPAGGLYGVTKIAMVGLTTALAKELGKDNIQVNCIAPGMTRSDAGLSLTPDDSPFVKLISMIAPKPRGEPDDLVGPLLLLCSSAGDWMTGQTLHVDGGWVMRG